MTNHQTETGTIDRVDELQYRPVSPRYRSVQITGAALAYALLSALALLLLLADSIWWCVAAETAIAVTCAINLAILAKAYLFKGYALREHDITYRTGVIFPKTTTVPFVRIQQVSISQNPVSKFFRLCAVEIVNGAQGMSSLVIRGLTNEEAEDLRSVITQRLDNDND